MKRKGIVAQWRSLKRDWHFYALLVLPVLYFIIFKYAPMYGNIIAFRKYLPGGPAYGTEWVGLHYFQMFITDPMFWQVFENTLLLSFYTLLFTFPAPIIFALLLNELKNILFKRFVQTTSYLPHFLSTVVVVGMITQVLSPSSGIINAMIKNLGFEPINFLLFPEWFRTIFVGSTLWEQLGWGAIIYLAALAGVNPNLYEAAKVDGANRWKQTIHVTIPAIMPTIVILLILQMGKLLEVGFEKILLLYNPMTYETADIIATYVYRMGIELNNYSYATAIGLFDSIVGVILIYLANKFASKVSDTSLW